MKSYYEILELESNATQEEISWAFSRLSLKYHPKRNEKKDFIYNNFKFSEIAEAYEVLSNCKKKYKITMTIVNIIILFIIYA